MIKTLSKSYSCIQKNVVLIASYIVRSEGLHSPKKCSPIFRATFLFYIYI